MDAFFKKYFEGRINNSETFFQLLGIIALLVVLIDSLWILLVMNNQYNQMIAEVQNESILVRIIPTILSYLTIIISILLFSVPKINATSRFKDSLLFGGLLGFLMYGMFSFTNYALIKKWSLFVVLLDSVWGVFLYTIVTYLASLFIV